MSEFTKEDYEALLRQINDNYDGANAQYQKIDAAAQSLCDVNQMMVNMPNMTVVRDNGGNVIGYDYVYTGPADVNTGDMEVDSNSGGSSFGTASGGGRTTRGGGAGRFPGTNDSTNGISSAKTSGGSSLVSGFIDAGWGAVSTLAKFGKNVASDAADAVAQVGEHAGELFNDLFTKAGDSTANVIRALFGVDTNGNTTMYLDEDTIGALAITARDDGCFGDPTVSEITSSPQDFIWGTMYVPVYRISPPIISTSAHDSRGNVINYPAVIYLGDGTVNGARCHTYINLGQTLSFNNLQMMTGRWSPSYGYNIMLACDISTTINTYLISIIAIEIESGLNHPWNSSAQAGEWNNRTAENKTEHFWLVNLSTTTYLDSPIYPLSTVNTNIRNWSYAYGWYMLYGSWESAAVPGISNQSGATSMVDAVTGADPHVVAQNLATQYPQIMGSPVQIVVLDDACNEVTKNYYSVPISYSPTNLTTIAPITGGLQVNPSFNPDVQLDLPDIDMSKYIDQVVNQLRGSGAGRDTSTTDPTTGDPTVIEGEAPNTGSGVTPPEVLPEANVQGVWHIYNPSSAEVSALGSWLWSANIIDQIVRMFSNPMEAIIGLHAVYAEPAVSSAQSIVVGNLTSTASARVVTKQYASLDCGSVWLTEYFGNVFDYDPYTKVSLFLPFIGIVDLKTADVMRAQIGVTYNVDVYTGACVAMVSVERDGVGGVLYQYTGCCAVEYPVSGANYSRMLQAIFASASSALGAGVMTMGAPGTAALGALAAGTTFMSKANMAVQRSGSFSGNAGAMGIKKPYLIITRPQTNMALQYEMYDGRGANYTRRVGECSGYIKCKEVHLNVPGAYKSELDEIEQLLKEGILI